MKAVQGIKTGIYMLSAALLMSLCAACGTVQEAVQSDSADSVSLVNTSPITVQPDKQENKILIAYFSRYGNTEFPENMDASTSASIVMDDDRFGTTGYLAQMIQQKIGGEIHFIQTETPYPADYQEVIDLNHQQMQRQDLPKLKENSLELSEYDTILIGYPVWATDVPRAVISFMNQYDLSGKTVIPFCTHAGYGAGTSYETIREAAKTDQFLNGLAVRDEQVRTSQELVSEWLDSLNLANDQKGETAITITIGDTVLDGVLYDTDLAQEIKQHMPLTVSMMGYGGREYYGGLAFTPEHISTGQLHFSNGDITYCPSNNTAAIFYAQTDRPNLTMEVIPIGKVVSDLEKFDTFEDREEITFALKE